MEEVMKG